MTVEKKTDCGVPQQAELTTRSNNFFDYYSANGILKSTKELGELEEDSAVMEVGGLEEDSAVMELGELEQDSAVTEVGELEEDSAVMDIEQYSWIQIFVPSSFP